MATPTYDLLESVTLATAASSITFASIDQSYGDLILTVTAGNDTTFGRPLLVKFNSDSGSNYNYVEMDGNGSTATSTSQSNTNRIFGSNNTRTYSLGDSLFTIQIMDYAATDKHKSVLSRVDNSNSADNEAGTKAYASRYANTTAISNIEITLEFGGNFVINSTFNLYGIAKTVV
jgi:hypothetical protein